MELQMRTFGTHAVEFVLKDVAQRSDRLKPALEVVGEQMLHSERRLFETSGLTGGHPWEPLKKQTITKKRRLNAPHPSRPLWFSGDLMRSLSDRSAEHNIFRATRLYVIIGTTHEAAPYHRSGTKHMAAREPIMFTDGQVKHWTNMINDFLLTGRISGA